MSDIPDYLIVDDYFEPNGEAVTEHHTEVFPDGTRHKMQTWRDEGDESPWDGDSYVYDERCTKCREEQVSGG